MKRSPSSQYGVALITVMLIVAFVVIIASDTALRIQTDFRRTYFNLHDAQAKQYALSGESFARELLFQDFEEDQKQENKTDSLKEVWHALTPPFDTDGGTIEIRISDVESRFNIASLMNDEGNTDPLAVQRFFTLLNTLSLPNELASTIADWQDKDTIPTALDSEDNYYLSLTPPYRTANQPISDITELLAVRGVNAEVFKLLSPYITATPTATKINVNTASAVVLQSLEPNLRAAEIVQERESREGPIQNFDDFKNNMSANAGQGPVVDNIPNHIVYRSTYFEVWVRATYGERTVYLRSVLFRHPGNGKITVTSRNYTRPETALLYNPFLSDNLLENDEDTPE